MGQVPSKGFEYNSRHRVEDNSHSIPRYYQWACDKCGYWENKIKQKACKKCNYGRMYGTWADRAGRLGTWKLKLKDKRRNEFWEFSEYT